MRQAEDGKAGLEMSELQEKLVFVALRVALHARLEGREAEESRGRLVHETSGGQGRRHSHGAAAGLSVSSRLSVCLSFSLSL